MIGTMNITNITTMKEENGMTTTIVTLETRYILECSDGDCRAAFQLEDPLDALPMHDRLDGSPCSFDGIAQVVGLAD